MDDDYNRTTGLNQSAHASVELHPTRVRWHIMALVMMTTAVATLGRLDLGVLGKYIQDEFHFSPETMGLIFSAFMFGYHPFQIPGGWSADRFGPRKVLAFTISFWAVFTAAITIIPRDPITHWLGLVWAFVVFRFLIGAGESATSPAATRVVASWMGTMRRGVGVSFHIIGIGVGGAFTPVFITWVALRYGWRVGFWISSLLGILIALGWWFYSTDRPEQHPRVNAAELALIGLGGTKAIPGIVRKDIPRKHTPWARIFSSVSVWGMLLSYFCQGYMPYIYMTWFFIYLERVRHLPMMKAGIWGSVPFVAIVVLAPLGGWFSDLAVAKFGKRRGRQSTVWVGMGCSAILIWVGSNTVNNTLAILMLAAALGLNYFALPSWWATCIDLTPTHAGSLSGLMNMCGGAWAAPIATAYIATHFGWTQALDFAALLTAMGGLLWIFVDASGNLEEAPVQSAAG